MTTADYALIISLASALVSLIALLWNVWQKYIFVKPTLQVSFAVFRPFLPTRSGTTMRAGEPFLSLNVTNIGPGPTTLHSCVGRTKRRPWRFRYQLGFLNPIHGDPLSPTPRSIGPFSGGLPAKIDAGESKSFYFPFNRECFLRQPVVQIGMHDTYGRYFWCRRRDYRKALERWRKEFGLEPCSKWPDDAAHEQEE